MKLFAAFLGAFAFSVLSALPVRAQDDVGAAVALVEAFVNEHLARLEQGRGSLLNDGPALRRYLVDPLADAVVRTNLEFDPVFDAQDFDITGLSVYADDDVPILQGAAQVWTEFDNFGAPQRIAYTLVKRSPGEPWQISLISSSANNWNLAQMVDAGRGDPNQPEIALGAEPAADEPIEGDMPGFRPDPSRGDMLFILDGSGSMWGQIDGVAKITTAKDALRGLAADLSGTLNLGLMAYGHNREADCSDIEVLLATGAHDSRVIGDFAELVTPRGKTPIAGALSRATDAISPGDRQADVLVISDGLETCGGDPCAAAASLAARGVRTRVHVVGFGLTEEQNAALSCIAEEGNGLQLAASNAAELTDALVEVAEAASADVPVPAPEPEVPPVPAAMPSEVRFEETFDGPLDPAWQVEQPAPELASLDGKGALFAAVAGTTVYSDEEPFNRYVLDEPLPDGDFDLVADARMSPQTGAAGLFLSLFDDAQNQYTAVLYQDTKGCGTRLILAAVRLSDGQMTVVDKDLFAGPFARDICRLGSAYAEKVLQSLEVDGARLTLKRRGRELTAAVTMTLPANDERAAEEMTVTTETLTALRVSGRAAFLPGQYSDARKGESHIWVDRFAIEVPAP
ncbi:VWA domain-containing protein [Acuticoccus sp. MNP-M23]|uniref:vWA domain-containing protein n=1 Tax=Acuticoccus sp. MNP-M23 TaxID=3072793 RepID=UPI0028167EDB|nr:VWA domain-containing protein [Acuticoccus sp. MNP-M23]WMS43478.1 VWA domain-containing protein [Acuticoccus sp. MNP-M23]